MQVCKPKPFVPEENIAQEIPTRRILASFLPIFQPLPS